MLSYVVGNTLYDAAYYGKIMAEVRIFMMMILKLSANCWQVATQSYRKGIKLPINEELL